MKIGIIGDGLIDRYWIGETGGLSPEAPIPVVKVVSKFDLPGGAANVRANLRALGCEAVMLMKALEAPQNYPVKNRLLVGDTQLARWDENDYCAAFEKKDLLALLDCDAVVVADYGKGSISEEVIQVLREVTIPLFVDTKGNPTPWVGSNAVMFPNLKEWEKYQQVYEWFPKVVLKQGAEGMAWVEFGRAIMFRPALNVGVRSVNGAGDTALAAFVSTYLAGSNLDYCLKFANAAAGVACGKPFTATVSVDEVENALYDSSNG